VQAGGLVIVGLQRHGVKAFKRMENQERGPAALFAGYAVIPEADIVLWYSTFDGAISPRRGGRPWLNVADLQSGSTGPCEPRCPYCGFARAIKNALTLSRCGLIE
jgi:hypothetical protein